MAPFRWPDDRSRLDFELLRHTSVSLYSSREVLAEHLGWLRKHQYLVHSFDCSGWVSEEDFHVQVGLNPAFLGYTGRNPAAFNDRLCQIEVPEVGGTALAFFSFDVFHRLSPEHAWHILDIIACWSRVRLLTGRRLLALVHSDDRNISVKPVGATPVFWNWTERGRNAREKREEARKNAGPPEGRQG
jgi:hypothetical protein